MTKCFRTGSIALTSVFALAVAGHAQETTTETQTAESSQCMQEVRSLAERINEEGSWLAGYPGPAGTGGFGTRYPYGTMGGTATTTTGTGAATPPPETAAGPWAGANWRQNPNFEMATLFRAANVLASHGNEEACLTVAAAAEQRYDEMSSQFRELGVQPEEVTNWREAELASAVPVTEVGYPRRIDDVIGTDVRNARDEDLGEVEDVVLNPQSGEIDYVVVSTGGFFGIGGQDVAVPWEHLRVTQRMATFVLPVDEAVMEQAPRISDDQASATQGAGSADRDSIDTFWQDQLSQQPAD